MSRLQFVAMVGCVVLLGQWSASGETPPAAEAAQSANSNSDRLGRVRDLIEASEHLEAAGALDLMREARNQANSLLAQEAARLAREQEELESLSRDLRQTPILIQALILEARDLPADFLVQIVDQSGGELIRPDSAADAGVPSAAILAEGATGSDEIRSLSELTGIEILSRPQIMALDGTPAQIQVGQSVRVVEGVSISDSGEVVTQYGAEDAGITLKVTPTTTSEGQIHLDLMVEHVRFSESDVPIFTDPSTGETIKSPIKDVRTAQTTIAVPDGRALILPVDHTDAAGDEESTLLLVLLPRVVEDEE